MKNELHRKGMFFGVVFIIILMISNATAVTNGPLNELDVADKDIGESQNIYFNEEKPDIEIIDVYGITEMTTCFGLVIINNGNVPFQCAPGGVPPLVIRLTLKKVFLKEASRSYSTSVCTDKPINPGEKRNWSIMLWENLFGVYRCYFEIDPNNQFEESNKDNNKVWAYFLLIFHFAPIKLTKLKYWTTGNEGII